ncbi:16S rRNA (guanine(527)-N(7))-methyltransferase RsmG [Chelativorans sp.]|uniref:16S rRNA (guanine(527)-N(7))-methyltransferase RsmG n=1 Tax=Chelativorans sp. TaxID=2203393 RepID=UPI0028120BAB|nr:16S rRNA (guanine(527)-N(7))-methyltransferase RsmG [Chelativorans sp.]
MSSDKLSALRAAAGPVSRETFRHLLTFEETFKRWNARINLAAPSTLPHLWERHILDSAQLLPLAPAAERWLDLGSGGGFPGAVVAILLIDREKAHVDLVESSHKKAAFLQNVLASSAAPATVHVKRIEACYGRIAAPEVITARALAPLPKLLKLIAPWMSGGTRALLHKGRGYLREVEESGAAWRFDLLEHKDSVGGEGVILEISNLHRR